MQIACARGFSIPGGLFGGVIKRAIAVQDRQNICVRHSIEGAVVQDGLNPLALGVGATLQRVDDGHGGFAFAQVAGNWLTQHTLGCGEVEHVVHDLEGYAQVAPVLAKPVLLDRGSAAKNAADSHAHREQARRLAINQVEMLLQRDRLAELLHLQQFTLDQLLRQFDQYIENAKIAFLHRDLEGLHVKPIAGEHAHRVAPLRICGGTAPADLGFIDDVVVDERRGVDDLDDGSEFYRAFAFVTEQFGGEQQ